MHQCSLLFFIPNPNLVPEESQMSQEAKKQLFPRNKQRANPAWFTPWAGDCYTLHYTNLGFVSSSSQLPPQNIFPTSLGRGKTSSLTWGCAGSRHSRAFWAQEPAHSFLVLTNSPLIWPHSQIKLSHYTETNPKYWQLIKGLVLRAAMKYNFME